jgi:alpha-glucosidase
MWWQWATIYQIYPRSFQDSDGDGIGDLEGIRRRLPYLHDLGVDAVWLSPIYRSPMRDFGYDVSDYRAIDPLFGTMEQFERLLADAHALGLKLLLDFVPNHTSDLHPWFEESASSRDNPRRDWYIWANPGPDGGPPTNWLSIFGGGSAWQWHEPSGQYYYHSFLASQPDLNWRNPAVRQEMWDTLRFWLDKGVDGFRVDVIWHLIKDDLLRDDPPNPDYKAGEPRHLQHRAIYSADRPEVHEIVAGMRAVIEEYDERLLIGEVYLPLQRMVAYYGEHGDGVHFPFNFVLIHTLWQAEDVARTIEEYEAALPDGAWPNWVITNHDRPRVAGRVGEQQAANAGLLLLTLRGTPTLYYGDELAIGEVPVPPERIVDPWPLLEPETGINRDPSRTPMQWSDAEYAGFSPAEPWLPLTEDWRTRNAERMGADEGSLLALYRRLLAIRRSEPALNRGAYRRVLLRGPVLGYERAHGEDRFVVVLNFSAEPQTVELPAQYARAELVLSTLPEASSSLSPIALRPSEGLLIRV